ncbi:hypothetical protein GCM10010286_16690 [Streptomyces toxytricini]|nr:hypothetical protein GCM10010286_16690 [Streptomyces toxytricini]
MVFSWSPLSEHPVSRRLAAKAAVSRAIRRTVVTALLPIGAGSPHRALGLGAVVRHCGQVRGILAEPAQPVGPPEGTKYLPEVLLGEPDQEPAA